MPVTVNWGTKEIFVPQNYLTSLGGSLYQLDVDQFRLDLKALESSAAGMPFLDTHNHNTEIFLSGVTYARFVEIINGYTVTFEEVITPYRIKAVGANHNISDVQSLNNVSLIIGNSAGLQTFGLTSTEIAAAVWDVLLSAHSITDTMGKALGLVPNIDTVTSSIDTKVDSVSSTVTTINSKVDTILVQTSTKYVVNQGWVDDVSNSRIRLEASVHQDGQFYVPSAGSTLSFQLYTDGVLIYSQAGIAMDANGLFRAIITNSNFNPPAGSNSVSIATITEGIGGVQHTSAVVISRVAFTE